jgi:peptidoglycan-associated lipoprotein
MFLRTLMMLALVLSVTACAHKDKTSSGDFSSTEMGTPPGNGVGGEGISTNPNGPAPGTQQDWVVNVGDRVFFDYDQYTLSPEAQHTLELQAEWLKKYPAVNITVSGHCDERGTREYNLALGDRRANAVKSHLVSLGIDASRINTISYGKERPAVLGSNPQAWAQNRRAVGEVN